MDVMEQRKTVSVGRKAFAAAAKKAKMLILEGRADADSHAAGQNAKGSAVRRSTGPNVFASTKRFHAGGGMIARVIVDGDAYEVSGRQLALLEQGKKPADLLLEPLPH